jgi:hypothetical protein
VSFLNLKFFIAEPQKQITIQKTLFAFGYGYKEDCDTIRLNDRELYIITFDDGSMMASDDLEDDYDLTYGHHKELDLRSLSIMEGRHKELGQAGQDVTQIAVDQSLKDAKHLWLLLGVLMDNHKQLHQTLDYHQAVALQMYLCNMSKRLQKIIDRMD